ncbi:hypothetical protein F5888DRAFT_1809817 [Russula emetica]|nr:hypothetical protein F5888DRAFT_1809817 [Russula emetica]
MTSDPINPYSTSPVQELTPVHEAYELTSSQEPVTNSEKYGFDKSMLPGVARYIYGPTTANTNLRRHLYQAHAEEYDKAVLEYKWTYKLSSEVGNASTHAARASRSCR